MDMEAIKRKADKVANEWWLAHLREKARLTANLAQDLIGVAETPDEVAIMDTLFARAAYYDKAADEFEELMASA